MEFSVCSFSLFVHLSVSVFFLHSLYSFQDISLVWFAVCPWAHPFQSLGLLSPSDENVSARLLGPHLSSLPCSAGLPAPLSIPTHFTGQFPLIRDALSLFPQKMENCRFIKISLTSIPPVALRGSGLSQKKPPPSKPGSRSAGAGGGVEFWFAGSRQYSGPNPQPWQPSPLGGQGRREGSSAL